MPLDLEGGRPYYLEMLLNQGVGPWHLYLGLKYHNSTLTRTQVPAEHEVQRVVVDSVIVQEKHVSELIWIVCKCISIVLLCSAAYTRVQHLVVYKDVRPEVGPCLHWYSY